MVVHAAVSTFLLGMGASQADDYNHDRDLRHNSKDLNTLNVIGWAVSLLVCIIVALIHAFK